MKTQLCFITANVQSISKPFTSGLVQDHADGQKLNAAKLECVTVTAFFTTSLASTWTDEQRGMVYKACNNS